MNLMQALRLQEFAQSVSSPDVVQGDQTGFSF